jgi:hypothetical protein
MTRMVTAGIFVIVLSSCSAAPERGVKVIVGAALIEGDRLVHERSAIVVEGTHIRAAGSQADVPIPAGSDKSDASGLFAVAAGSAPLRAGEPANVDFLACNPIAQPSCRSQVKRSMRSGEWSASLGGTK